MDNRRNYYRILHVQPDAPTEIIRMSYLTLMQRMKMHPDLGGNHAMATLINEAFAILIDPEQRAVYDRTLARQHAYPGYRSNAEHRQHPDRPAPAPKTANPFACAFCGTAFSRAEISRKDAVCSFCDSPLYPASRHEHEDASRRAISRVPRRLPITFYLSWPQPSGMTGTTGDVSINGMRFTTDLDLVTNERLKIECDLCSAVAVVRHSHLVAGTTGTWDIGVEFLTLLIKPTKGLLVSTKA